MPSLPLGEDAKTFLSRADSGTPSIRAQKERHDSLLHRPITFLNSHLTFQLCISARSVGQFGRWVGGTFTVKSTGLVVLFARLKITEHTL